MKGCAMNNNYFYLNSRDELYCMNINKTVFMEGDGNYTHIYQKNKLKASVCVNLGNMQKLLEDNLHEKSSIFVRVGKRYIVNRNYIYQIQTLSQKLVLSDGENFAYQLSISKEALKQLKQLIVEIGKEQFEKK